MAKQVEFEIPKIVQDNYPKLVELIKEARSMNNEEKQYWFRILPVVQKEHIKKLFKILITEKKELDKIDNEYKNNLRKLNESKDTYNVEALKQKSEARKKLEAEHEKDEELLEEEILKEIDASDA